MAIAVAQFQGVPTKNSIRASELISCRSERTVRSDWTAPSWLVLALGSCGPDRPARIVRAETGADRFLHQLPGE
jgi:hypothetical protein